MRQVDIWRENGKIVASMRWANKRCRCSFILKPIKGFASCEDCIFKEVPICGRWKKNSLGGHLCSMLWRYPGDNIFEGRYKILAWQPIGPLGNKKKE